MASNAVDVGNGITVVLATSTFHETFQLLSIKPPGFAREFLPTTHMGTDITPAAGVVGTMTKIASDHVEITPMQMTGHFNPDLLPPFIMAAVTGETVTITFLGPGDAAGATWVFTGGLSSFDPDEFQIGEVMKVNLEFTPTAGVTIAADA